MSPGPSPRLLLWLADLGLIRGRRSEADIAGKSPGLAPAPPQIRPGPLPASAQPLCWALPSPKPLSPKSRKSARAKNNASLHGRILLVNKQAGNNELRHVVRFLFVGVQLEFFLDLVQ